MWTDEMKKVLATGGLLLVLVSVGAGVAIGFLIGAAL